MAWRVIVRFSLNSDTRSAARNSVGALLRSHGINRTATGTWESAAMPEMRAAQCLAGILGQLANPAGIGGANPQVHLDHLWVYVDVA